MAEYRKLGGDRLLCESIVNEIEHMVVEGELKPGDVLPPQEELAARFGVSRTVVREAAKVLAAKQLVTVRRGKGMIVSYPSPSTVTASLSLLLRLGQATLIQLTELRRFIEPQMAALAAQRGSSQEIESIKEIESASRAFLDTRNQIHSHEQRERLAAVDLAFHQAVWGVARNEVARAVLESIVTLFRESLVATYSLPRGPGLALSDHRLIAEAIAVRDATEAQRQMDLHLVHAMVQLTSLDEEKSFGQAELSL